MTTRTRRKGGVSTVEATSLDSPRLSAKQTLADASSGAFTWPHFERWAARLVLDNGERWVIEPWQERFVRDLFECRARENWLIVPEGNGKALALDTPIPTPDGWTDMGSLQVGDAVFDEAGERCEVVLCTETMYGHACYRVVFSDGTSVVADADHLWQVRDEYAETRSGGERITGLDRVLTTEQIAATHRVDRKAQRAHRYSVPKQAVLECEDAHLPVDPYVLGAWLGDGASANARVTFGEPFVREEIERCGYEVGAPSPSSELRGVPTATVYGLQSDLRELGVIGRKHIPAGYMRASRRQRLALLQGLMDTDGAISAGQGQCTLTSSAPRLAADVLELVRTLGLKATMREYRAKIKGRDCGPAWQVQFHAFDETPVFRMPRKFNRQRPRPSRRALSETRRIVDVIPVDSVPVRCIQVDSPSRLYLAGDGMVATHNTTMVAALALYGLRFSEDALIPVAASSRDQARVLYRQAKGFLRRSELDDPGFEFQAFDGYRRIDLRGPGRTKRGEVLGSIEVHAADAGTGDGIIPFPFAFLDELHRHRSLDLYETWRGKLDKRQAQMVTISTAGESGGDFEVTRERVRQETPAVSRVPGFTHCRSDGIVLHEFALEEGGDPEDMVAVKRCNPLGAITVESLGAKRGSPTMSAAHWARFVCNVPMRSGAAAIAESEWHDAATAEPIPDGAEVWLGFDVGWQHDTTAIVPLWWESAEHRQLGPATVLEPPEGGEQLDVRLIKRAFVELCSRFRVSTVVMDSSRAEDIAAWLSDEMGLEVVYRAQGTASQAEDYERFMAALRQGWLRHAGDDGMRSHALNAVTKLLPNGGAKFGRPSQSRSGENRGRVIDALVAAAMVHSVRCEDAGEVWVG